MTTTAATTGQALLAAILAEPDADDLRLIYADWLAENGQEERAEFIRVQCQVEKTEFICDSRDINYCNCEHCQLRRRGQALFDRLGLPDERAAAFGLPGWIYVEDFDGTVREPWRGRAVVRRGFVERITLPCADWLMHGPAIVRAHPVREVRLNDRQPAERGGFVDGGTYYSWECGPGLPGQNVLPAEIFSHLPQTTRSPRDIHPDTPYVMYLHSAEHALRALSAACLRYARDTEPATECQP